MTARAAMPQDSAALVAGALAELRERAAGAMNAAYAPYSGFRVGSALLAADGSITVGCNVENASYPAGVCAERVALGAAVAHGRREFLAIAIATEAEAPTPPCGVCRQALVEFSPDLVVLSVTRGGREARWSLADLLPNAFTPHSLDHSRH
ncbi:MAG TPA: cytidine deaminase [Gemmatimonadaceae bacterium]